jgi:hypothetical protein
MSKYSTDKKDDKQFDNKIRADNRITEERKPSVIVNSDVGSQNGVDLLFPKTTIVGSSFDNSSNAISDTVPITLTTSSSITKDDHYVALTNSPETPESTKTLAIPSKKSSSSSDENEIANATFKGDYMTQFYIGSLSVVGLFVFYRFIQKR